MVKNGQVSGPGLQGVFPVLSTPFDVRGECDAGSFSGIVGYVARAGAHGAVYPAIASEFATLSNSERSHMTGIALSECRQLALPLIVGISARTVEDSRRLAADASEGGACALMLMAPRSAGTESEGVIAFFREVADAAGDTPLIMQNAPPPLGSALPVATVRAVVEAVPKIRYVKEENVPCGQRVTALIRRAPPTLEGVMGGAGGRFVLDEYARGACGSMPACELVEVHVAIWKAVRCGDNRQARRLFTRILPLLTLAGVYRQAVVKRILKHRGLIAFDTLRDDDVPIDDYDRAEIDSVYADIEDLISNPGEIGRAAQ